MSPYRSWRERMADKRGWDVLPTYAELTVREQVQGIRAETKRALQLLEKHTFAIHQHLVEVKLDRHWRTWFRKRTVDAYQLACRSGGNKRTIAFYFEPGSSRIIQIGNYHMGSPYWTNDDHNQDLPWNCTGTRRTVILQGLEEFCARVAGSNKRPV